MLRRNVTRQVGAMSRGGVGPTNIRLASSSASSSSSSSSSPRSRFLTTAAIIAGGFAHSTGQLGPAEASTRERQLSPKSAAKSDAGDERVMRDGDEDGDGFDLLIVGGGATGAGVAVDAATRGLSVAMVEKDDFGAGESTLYMRAREGTCEKLTCIPEQEPRPSRPSSSMEVCATSRRPSSSSTTTVQDGARGAP
ncbi:hypothetical protein L7F22_047794 [Adiantum nelumboides]|nr:hypothetical protein [Adiantum nelumboides]